MFSLNRTALIVSAKQVFVDWYNQLPDTEEQLSLEEFNSEPTVFLTPPLESIENLDELIEVLAPSICMEQFGSWCSDEKLLPCDLSEIEFSKWFDVRVSTATYDFVEDEIEREEF